jgi:hypothetical protein
VRVAQIENWDDAEILKMFHEPRDEDYKQLAARYRKLLQSLEKKKSRRPLPCEPGVLKRPAATSARRSTSPSCAESDG